MTINREEWLVMSFPITVCALPDGLTPSERAVLEAVLRGLSNSDISRERGTSVHTIRNQIASVFRKLGVKSRLELVCLCTVVGTEGAKSRGTD
jgi:DNA-binding NarL/FixJ family response regulator